MTLVIALNVAFLVAFDRIGVGASSINTSPLNENTKVEQNSSPIKSSSPLSEDEVCTVPYPGVD